LLARRSEVTNVSGVVDEAAVSCEHLVIRRTIDTAIHARVRPGRHSPPTSSPQPAANQPPTNQITKQEPPIFSHQGSTAPTDHQPPATSQQPPAINRQPFATTSLMRKAHSRSENMLFHKSNRTRSNVTHGTRSATTLMSSILRSTSACRVATHATIRVPTHIGQFQLSQLLGCVVSFLDVLSASWMCCQLLGRVVSFLDVLSAS
jgi:hypothetical protein